MTQETKSKIKEVERLEETEVDAKNKEGVL